MAINLSRIKTVQALEDFLAVGNGFFQDIEGIFKTYTKKIEVKKKSGGLRTVYEAIGVLAEAHRVFQLKAQMFFKIHRAAYGYMKGKSQRDNAAIHAGKMTIVKVDIKDFFNSIMSTSIVDVLIKIGFQKDMAEVIAPVFCTFGSLEAGFCTSSVIANAVCYELDAELEAWADSHKLNYTRYSDDMTFSSDNRLNFSVKDIQKIIEKFGFTLNEKKTKFMFRGEPQYVTGFSVTEDGEPKVPKDLKNTLRKELYYINKFGLRSHMERKYGNSRLITEKIVSSEIAKVSGMISYISGMELSFISKLEEKGMIPKAKDFKSYLEHFSSC